MCGNDTFTTVVSRTSMKVLDMTATAINQGLTSTRGFSAIGLVRRSDHLR